MNLKKVFNMCSNISYIMANKKLLVFIILAIFCMGLTLNSASSIEFSNSTDNIAVVEENNSENSLNMCNNENLFDNLSKSEDSLNLVNEKEDNDNLSKSADSNDNLTFCESSTLEILCLNLKSQEEVLSSSVSVSNDKGHTYHINGYTFTVSANQYKKIKSAIKMGKQHDWLDNGFKFKVKTNKIYTYKKPIYKIKKVKKYKWKYKKLRVSQEKYWDYEWKYYTNQKTKGWTCYKLVETDFEYGVPHKHYVYLKKKVKYTAKKKVKTGKYKKVKMMVYATIKYQGWSMYDDGPHYYYPWVDFDAIKKGYSKQYLSEAELR